eukprot:6692046-Pyramimonas_sp.AAC.1
MMRRWTRRGWERTTSITQESPTMLNDTLPPRSLCLGPYKGSLPLWELPPWGEPCEHLEPCRSTILRTSAPRVNLTVTPWRPQIVPERYSWNFSTANS